MNALPALNFLTADSQFNDYRPAIDATGKMVVFERTPIAPGSLTVLNVISDIDNPQPRPFLTRGPPSQTRPDWCWQNGYLLFNGAQSNDANPNVWLAIGSTPLLATVPNTTGSDYPTFDLDGQSFVTENSAGSPKPHNTVFDLQGNILAENISGGIGDMLLYGGMPATGPKGLPQIAFAGQPIVANWAGGSGTYNQNYNYIFLHQPNGDGTCTTAPMEQDAPLGYYDTQYQGRAPAWSPDGQTIAFESNRSNQGYAIYLYSIATGNVVQVTDPSLEAQHAKFFPDGTKLILCIRHPGNNPATMGIAWVDISGLLGS